jgi:hypothetical protein
MMPLCTSEKLPSAVEWGWALAIVTPPCVAQRVWATPVVPVMRVRCSFSFTSSTPPMFLRTAISPRSSVARPQES